jgi:hypothetical protein
MMSKKMWLIVVGIVALGGILVYSLRTRSLHSSESSPAKELSGPHLAWKFASDRTIFSSLTLGADGTIYASSNQSVFAISPDGKQKWHTVCGSISYTAMGTDGMLYAAEMHGLIFGISPDGTVSWKPGYGLIGFHAPPAMGSNETILFANSTSDLYAFEQGSTTAAWSQNTFRPGAIGENSSLAGTAAVGTDSASSPVVYSDGSIALPRQHWLNRFGSDGTPAWQLELTPGGLGLAALGEDGSIYVGDNRYTLYAVDQSGELEWKYEPDGIVIGSPVVDAEGVIYFSTTRSVYALDRLGNKKWQVQPKHSYFSSPTLAADGSTYLTGSEGLSALGPDGTEKWVAQTPGANMPPAIAADGTVYFVCGSIWVCAVQGLSSPLMKSPWPRIYHDSQNTGNILTTY